MKFKANIKKGLKEFPKVEKDFRKYEQQTRKAKLVSWNVMNTQMDF